MSSEPSATSTPASPTLIPSSLPDEHQMSASPSPVCTPELESSPESIEEMRAPDRWNMSSSEDELFRPRNRQNGARRVLVYESDTTSGVFSLSASEDVIEPDVAVVVVNLDPAPEVDEPREEIGEIEIIEIDEENSIAGPSSQHTTPLSHVQADITEWCLGHHHYVLNNDPRMYDTLMRVTECTVHCPLYAVHQRDAHVAICDGDTHRVSCEQNYPTVCTEVQRGVLPSQMPCTKNCTQYLLGCIDGDQAVMSAVWTVPSPH